MVVTLASVSSIRNLRAIVFYVAPRKQNPLDDIGSTVGGWLGGAAKSLNTFLTGDRNPTLNPQTRQGIRALQEVGDVASSGAVSAMQQGPDAVVRYANTQLAIAAASGVVGAVGPAAVSKAAKTKAGQAVIRKAEDIAFQAQMLKPITTRKSIQAQRPLLQKYLEARGQIGELEDQIYFAQKGQRGPDYDYMDLYESANPVARETRETIAGINDVALSRGRKNKMLMDAAQSAYRGIDEDWNQEEIRFAKRFFREKGKASRGVVEAKRAILNRLPPAERAEYIQKQEVLRRIRLQRLLDISNARRNMPENYIDPEDFLK